MTTRAQDKIHFTQQQYEYLLKTFPAPVITPESTMNELQNAAGAHRVVQMVGRLVVPFERVYVQ